MPDRDALAQAMRSLRANSGLTQEALGLRAGLQPSYISDIERGARNPSFESLSKLLSAMGSNWTQFAAMLEACQIG
jgi:transcriptional regulator with XRE-family HTH domain